MSTIGYRQYPLNHPKATNRLMRRGLNFGHSGEGTYDIEWDSQTIGRLRSDTTDFYSTFARYSPQWHISWGPIVPNGRGHLTHSHTARNFLAAKTWVREHIDAIRAGETV